MRKWSLIVVCLVLSLSVSCGVSNVIGSILISDQDEVKLGTAFKAEILADSATYRQYRRNPAVNAYITALGLSISDAQKDRDTLNFTFTVLEDSSINAFAIPGGHVFIYTGLLKAAKNEAEVAGVLAHEVAHITKYHGRNALAQNAAAGLINDILFGDSSNVGRAAAQIVEGLAFLKFGRENEFQADSCAVAYTSKIARNPVGMKHFLSTLLEKYGEQPKVFEPFSTHPNVSDRIAEVQKVMTKLGVTDTTSNLGETEFLAIKGAI